VAVLQALFGVGINLFKHNVSVDGEGLVSEDLQGLLNQTTLLLIQFYMVAVSYFVKDIGVNKASSERYLLIKSCSNV
jgi:hypothetical protein